MGLALLMNSMKKKASEGRYLGVTLVCLMIVLFSFGSIYKRKGHLKSIWMILSNFSLVIHPNSQPAKVISIIKEDIPPGSLVLSQHSDLPLFAGCLPAMSDPLTIMDISKYTGWEPTVLLDALRDRRIKLVVMEEKVTTERPMIYLSGNVAEAILENYKPLIISQVGYYLYVPK